MDSKEKSGRRAKLSSPTEKLSPEEREKWRAVIMGLEVS